MRYLIIIGICSLIICCDKNQDICSDSNPTYDTTIQVIIEGSCNNGDCHVGPNGGWAVLPDFSSYTNLLQYLESGTFDTRINSQDSTLSMPPLFREDRIISDSDLLLLNEWICNGFPES